MSLRRLRTLVAVADERTFSAAAERVHVTHAAVSQQMQALEADLGLALFDRRGRTPELTPVAHRVVARARWLIADYDRLVPEALGDGGLSGTIRLGAIGTTLTGLVPLALANLKSHAPELGLHIRPGLTGALLADIERGHLDAAIVTRPHLLPPDLILQDLVTEPMQLITAMEETEDDPLRLLTSRPYIRFNRNAVLGTLIDNWLAAQGLRVSEAMELDSAEAITSMVQANLGVSIVPDLTVGPSVAAGVRRLSLGSDAPQRVLALAQRRDHSNTEALEALAVALRNTIGPQAA